jgi:hypothetical protein
MTSDVERVVEQKFLVHCSCGAAIETSETKETCRDCEILRRSATPKGEKYTLRIGKHRPHRHKDSVQWPTGPMPGPVERSSERRHRTGPRLESPDYNERFLRVGLLTLLAPLYLPLFLLLFLCLTPVTVEQDRPHHYVRHDIQLHDARGRALTLPTWKRVDD